MDNFYRAILGLEREPSLGSDRMTQGYGAEVAFVTDGATQFYLATKDLGIGFKRKQVVNPLERGHIAFRTDDIEAFKKAARREGHPVFGLRHLVDEGVVSDLLL